MRNVFFHGCHLLSFITALIEEMAKVELLIKLVKKHKMLYDMEDEDYKNTKKKDKIWNEIGLELEESGDELKKKWKNLRDSFSKYVRSTKCTTGQAAVHKTWIWAKQMEYFRPFISFAKTSSNVSGIELSEPFSFTETFQCKEESPESHMDDESNDEFNQSIVSNSTVDTEKPELKPFERSTAQSTSSMKDEIEYNKSKDELNQSIVSIPAVDTERPALKRLKRRTPQPTFSVKDEIECVDMLFMAYAHTIKKFSPRRQAQVKFKIAELIMEEELANIEENSPC
ncbi:uncharacterized protein LOC133845288 isoform X2 [Drosophila sulfurigaster albostrigata]|uniref:uncharacterized protein LOC133845288 isoform X2 n=1 Tax=Drosophila sulfurigaster albostrigata TaxID=89887 RepID=UPI002D21C181|nr:uncharacterized protein LOC133845288 isoform X2 [Drosophila sulfurigaster albostrigata]